MNNSNEIDSHVRQWIKQAGNRIQESLKGTLDISTKSNRNDLVTNVDKETEQFFIEKIRKTYPNHRILGEEGFGDKIEDLNGVIWVIDPIDGTMNFVHQRRNFMISIGIYEDGEGILGYIYDVIHDELYFGEKGKGAYFKEEKLSGLQDVSLEDALIGINATWVTDNKRIDPSILSPLVKQAQGTRSFGSAALEMAYVATGWLDAYITTRLAPWDFAAGKIIIEELGGKATTLTGEPLSILKKSSVIFAKPGLHEYIMNHFLKDYRE